uniref:MFS monosaccharide transporter-like protein n=1 Tax=Orbilia oligospora TaxID=2813651 RepID=A0A481ZKR7_ORBOL|nr:MFS monosaccharide transporter-like protein [Orbilia oligospora]QBL02032.1 MFS monosaccharide transporter-like protein [Orbilia oligospora]
MFILYIINYKSNKFNIIKIRLTLIFLIPLYYKILLFIKQVGVNFIFYYGTTFFILLSHFQK